MLPNSTDVIGSAGKASRVCDHRSAPLELEAARPPGRIRAHWLRRAQWLWRALANFVAGPRAANGTRAAASPSSKT